MWQHLAARGSGDDIIFIICIIIIIFILFQLICAQVKWQGAERVGNRGYWEGNSQSLPGHINSWVIPGEIEKPVGTKEGSGGGENADVQKEVTDRVTLEWVRERVAIWLLKGFLLLDSYHMKTDCRFFVFCQMLLYYNQSPLWHYFKWISIFLQLKKTPKKECYKNQG